MTNYQERCLNTLLLNLQDTAAIALSTAIKYYTRTEYDNLQDFLSTAFKQVTDKLRADTQFSDAQLRLQFTNAVVYADRYRDHGNNICDLDYILYIIVDHLSTNSADIDKAKQTAMPVLVDMLYSMSVNALNQAYSREHSSESDD